MSDITTFKDRWLNRQIDYDHVYAYQCVDLILQYIYEIYGLPSGVRGNAIDYWNNPSKPLLDKFNKVPTSDAIASDIVVLHGLGGNPYGHVGIATGSSNAAQVEILEQNGQTGSGTGQGGDAIRTRFIDRTRIAGVLRPKPAATVVVVNAPAPDQAAVHLPASVPSWALYRVGSGLRKGTSDQIATLAPSKYGGLTYPIVARVGDYGVVIDTQMYGRGVIWVKGTDAQFTAIGQTIAQPAPAPAPTPAPQPTPAPVPEPKLFTENTVDGITYRVELNAPKMMYVVKPGGCDIFSFKDVSTWRDFKSVGRIGYAESIYIVGSARHPIPPKGALYYMQDPDFGDFKRTGHVTNMVGINWADLSETKPAPLPQPEPAAPAIGVVQPTVVPEAIPPATHVETPPAAATAPINWKDTYQPFPQPVHYVAVRNMMVKDLDGQQPDMPLPKYVPGAKPDIGKVSAYGTVSKDGVAYHRLRTNNDAGFNYWYSIPKIDPDTQTPLLLVIPTVPLKPVSKVVVAQDMLKLGKTHIEKGLPAFIDDMLPKWLKPKNKK